MKGRRQEHQSCFTVLFQVEKNGKSRLHIWDSQVMKSVTLTTELVIPLTQCWLSWNGRHRTALWEICTMLWWNVTWPRWLKNCSAHFRKLEKSTKTSLFVLYS